MNISCGTLDLKDAIIIPSTFVHTGDKILEDGKNLLPITLLFGDDDVEKTDDQSLFFSIPGFNKKSRLKLRNALMNLCSMKGMFGIDKAMYSIQPDWKYTQLTTENGMRWSCPLRNLEFALRTFCLEHLPLFDTGRVGYFTDYNNQWMQRYLNDAGTCEIKAERWSMDDAGKIQYVLLRGAGKEAYLTLFIGSEEGGNLDFETPIPAAFLGPYTFMQLMEQFRQLD